MLTAAQKAKARARQRSRPAAPANDNVVCFSAPAPLELTAADVVRDDADEAPFAPPPADDIFGLGECEEEVAEFVATPTAPQAEAAVDKFEDDVPFDPPEFDAEPVFSPPASAQLGVPLPPPPPAPSHREEPSRPRERPLPAISIYASWDRSEGEVLFAGLAADRRFDRAEMRIASGGLDGAVAHCVAHQPPDLVLLESALEGRALLDGLDRLRAAAPRAAVVVLGGVNDITLLRELGARGVSDYIVAPASADDVAVSLCRLFAEVSPARVVAVVGARGGVGASTIAHNLAFSIAERQQLRTTLADFDLSFGSAAFNFRQTPGGSIAGVLSAGDDVDAALSQALTAITPRLGLVAAPDRVECVDIGFDAFARAMAEVRRASAYVVLDLPHVWEPWVRQALCEADEIVIVAAPDLASLRNADNMLKLLRSERVKVSAPRVVLSMAGVPRRPEIPLKDFAEALHVKPAMTFAFEPDLFGRAQAKGEMIYETMADAKAALQLDTLASLLTGRAPRFEPARRASAKPFENTAAQPKPKAPAASPQSAPEAPILDLVIEVPNEPPIAVTAPLAKRRAARTGFLALQTPVEPQRRRSSGLLRVAAALIALVTATAYYVQQQRATAEAAPHGSLSPTSA
ncbi:MAG: CpaE family protein [Hyphomonadaceae bacterium]